MQTLTVLFCNWCFLPVHSQYLKKENVITEVHIYQTAQSVSVDALIFLKNSFNLEYFTAMPLRFSKWIHLLNLNPSAELI